MSLLSRRANVKRVEIESARDGDEPISVTIRGMRGTEENWARGDESFNRENDITVDTAVRAARVGLVDVHGVSDPDTGKPFELKFTNTKIHDRTVQIISLECVDALWNYIPRIGLEVFRLTHLEELEKAAIPFTGTLSTVPASVAVPNVPTETNIAVKPDA